MKYIYRFVFFSITEKHDWWSCTLLPECDTSFMLFLENILLFACHQAKCLHGSGLRHPSSIIRTANLSGMWLMASNQVHSVVIKLLFTLARHRLPRERWEFDVYKTLKLEIILSCSHELDSNTQFSIVNQPVFSERWSLVPTGLRPKRRWVMLIYIAFAIKYNCVLNKGNTKC